MLHSQDFDRLSSTYLGDMETRSKGGIDPVRAPRGLLVGIGIGIALWGSAIMAFFASN